MWQHKQNLVDGFGRQHGLHILVYFEQFDDMVSAITREKQLKKWNRAWKINLVENMNSNWQDLYLELTGS